jgi:hypothetical protein
MRRERRRRCEEEPGSACSARPGPARLSARQTDPLGPGPPGPARSAVFPVSTPKAAGGSPARARRVRARTPPSPRARVASPPTPWLREAGAERERERERELPRVAAAVPSAAPSTANSAAGAASARVRRVRSDSSVSLRVRSTAAAWRWQPRRGPERRAPPRAVAWRRAVAVSAASRSSRTGWE